MSCYIVTDNHINAIIGYANTEKIELDGQAGTGFIYTKGLEAEACNLLLAANVRSVNARYRQAYTEDRLHFVSPTTGLTHIEAIKACDGLAYQCDEWDGFEGSHAQKLLATIQRHATHKLPGYDAAPWSIE